MLALRVQEEYAFKEAISATFEGYKREMANIPGAETRVLPILLRRIRKRRSRLLPFPEENREITE